MIASPPAARCAATVGHHVGEYGEVPIQCHQQRGLRAVVYRAKPDSIGDVVYYCAAPHHRDRAIAQARRGFRP